MKVWMVILIAGRVIGAEGPLPYTIDECRRATAEVRDIAVNGIRKELPYTDVSQIVLECRYSDTEPR